MPKRYFNWKLAVVLLIALVVLGITAFGLRKWQRSRRADRGLVLGNKAYNEHRWEEAAKYLGSYLAVVRNDVPALLKYADAQLNISPLKRNNVQQAIGAYRTILRIDKNNSESATRLVEIYLEMRMPGEAELIASRALESNQSPELQRMLAISLINQRRFEEAERILKSIIKEHPEQIPTYEVLGRLLEYRPEDFTQSPQSLFDEVVKNNPSSALAYIIRAGFHLRYNAKAKALADLEKAEKLELSNSAVRLRLAGAFINANIPDKAEKHLTAVQNTDPTNQTLWQLWAKLALKLNSKTMMLKVAETGLKELSAQPWDFMPIAVELYILCDKLDRADDCISKLRQKDIDSSGTAFLEGLVADKKGRSYEAVECWQRAIQLGDKLGRTRLALAVTLSRLGDKQSAIKQLRTLVSEQPNSFNGHTSLARLLTETGNWAEAAEQARIARQISPDSIEAALLHAQIQTKLLSENQIAKNSPMWHGTENLLASLENATNGAPEVKLLQFRLAIQQDNLAGAKTIIAELKKSYPSAVKVVMAEAELLIAQKREDEAVSKLANIVNEFPQEPEPVEYLATLLAGNGRQEECEIFLKDALERFDSPAVQQRLHLLLADLYSRWGLQEKAYELLSSAVQKLSNYIPIKRRLLRCEKTIENTEEAQKLIDDIKSLEGEEGWQWRYEQAKLWFTQDDFKNRYPQIISLLKENLFTNPEDQASRILLASAYEKSGELQLAISTYQEALNRSPGDIRIIVPIVSSLYKTNEYDRADKILQQVADGKLFHPELKRLELQSYLRRGELDSAGNILENMLANDPNNQSIYLSLALLRSQQKRFAEANKLLNELKTREPNYLPATVAQIDLNVKQNKPAEALLLCDEVVNKLNNAPAHILRARTYAMLGRTDEAQKDYEYATTIEPNNVGAWAAQSNFYRSSDRPDKAIASIRKAMLVAPDNLTVQKQTISLLLSSDNQDAISEGKEMLEKVLAVNPDDVELRLYKARSLLAEGTAPSIEKSIKILQKLTEDQPKSSDAWAILAEIALRQERPTKAMDIVLRGLVHRPNNKSLLLLKARSEAARSPVLAIPTLKALQELHPEDIDIALNLANTYLAADDSEKAVNLIEKQLAICKGSPDERKVNTALAAALYKSGNKKDAIRKFDALLQSDSNDPAPLLALSKIFSDEQLWDRLSQTVSQWYRNNPEDNHTPVTIAKGLAASKNSQAPKTAEGILQMVLRNAPDCAEAMNALAMLLQTTGRITESTALYQQVLALQPDNIIAINNLAWILCEEQGKCRQALELAQQGLETAPDYIDLIDTRGVAYHRLGEFDKAVEDFTRCLKLYPEGAASLAASHLHLGRSLSELGQKDKAIENLKKALQLNNKTGSLSSTDLIEAQSLLKKLSPGGV